MEKKKKPPPGATLISRLRESRLRREQAVEERKAGGGAVNKVPAATVPAEPKHVPAVSRPETGAARGAKQAPTAGQADGLTAGSRVTTAGAPARSHKAESLSVRPTGIDFSHRSISIDDLRPQSQDYEQLTEEIRLAGKFAAAGLIAQGLRLAILRDAQIYKNHHPTFEEYCRDEHAMSATYAYRLIRMAEMAGRLTEEGHKPITKHTTESMPDPFEVMLGLGHRHMLAILPLDADAAEELLLKGVLIATESGARHKRIPIAKATEQQIREAVRLLKAPASEPKVKKTSAPPARAVRTMEDLVDLMQEWSQWLSGDPDERMVATKIGEGADLGKLSRRLQTASERLIKSLGSIKKK